MAAKKAKPKKKKKAAKTPGTAYFFLPIGASEYGEIDIFSQKPTVSTKAEKILMSGVDSDFREHEQLVEITRTEVKAGRGRAESFCREGIEELFGIKLEEGHHYTVTIAKAE